MKAKYAVIGITLIVLISFSLAFTPVEKDSSKGINILNSYPIPDSLNNIFKNSCYMCHSDKGKYFAKMKLNFSEWDNYSTEKKVDKGAAICKVVSEGIMPPTSIRKEKPETIPTKAQIKSICNWSTSIHVGKYKTN